MGGRLRRYADAWQDINTKVVRWLRDGYKLPFIEGGEAEANTMLRKVCPLNLCIHYSDKIRGLFAQSSCKQCEAGFYCNSEANDGT